MSASSTSKQDDDDEVWTLRGKLELRTWLHLLACSNLMLTRLRGHLRAEFGMTLPTFDILVQIHRPPRGPTMGELSTRLMVSKGSVTDLIERLERRGLVVRRADPDDGRVQHVFLSARGSAILDRVIPRHDSWITGAMAGLDRSELAELNRTLGALKDVLRAEKATPARKRRATAKAPGPRA